jgi:hypothetical protein
VSEKYGTCVKIDALGRDSSPKICFARILPDRTADREVCRLILFGPCRLILFLGAKESKLAKYPSDTHTHHHTQASRQGLIYVPQFHHLRGIGLCRLIRFSTSPVQNRKKANQTAHFSLSLFPRNLTPKSGSKSAPVYAAPMRSIPGARPSNFSPAKARTTADSPRSPDPAQRVN